MYVAAPFTIVQNWKQLQCPPGGRMKKLWYIQTTEYYSAINSIKPLISVTTWTNLKGILSERSQSQNGYVLFDSVYMTFLKRQNYSHVKEWLPGVRMGKGVITK